MKNTAPSSPKPPKPVKPPKPPKPVTKHTLKRQPDQSPFSNNGAGILLFFENPATLDFVRSAAESAIQPANDLERTLLEQAVRHLWRTLRIGNLETAAIDIEIAEHRKGVEKTWGKIDPESLYHLCTRATTTRPSIREYTILENLAIRHFKLTADTIKALRKKI